MSLIPIINRANQIRNTTAFVPKIMYLSYNPTIYLDFLVQTASGDDWEIDWGDGVWEQYVSSEFTYRTKAFGTSTAGVARVRSATGRGLSDLQFVASSDGTWSFDVADLYATIGISFIGDLMTITGDVVDIKANSYVNFSGDLMTITGNVGDIKATIQAEFYGHLMTLTGDIADIKADSSVAFDGNLMELTYTTKTWTNIPIYYLSLSLATGHLSTAELSQMLIDMDASGITGDATLYFRYNNGAPNAAGITAADNLRGKGYTVLTN